MLVEMGADLNSQNSVGQTPLHTALELGKTHKFDWAELEKHLD